MNLRCARIVVQFGPSETRFLRETGVLDTKTYPDLRFGLRSQPSYEECKGNKHHKAATRDQPMASDPRRRNFFILAFLFAMFAVVMLATGKLSFAVTNFAIATIMVVFAAAVSRKAIRPDDANGTQPPVGESGKVP